MAEFNFLSQFRLAESQLADKRAAWAKSRAIVAHIEELGWMLVQKAAFDHIVTN